ncbi:MAG: chemotaxis protein methyltransferase CheR [Paracoccaceae bacterium]|jgi:chemotaxis protein methyltransferase CheR
MTPPPSAQAFTMPKSDAVHFSDEEFSFISNLAHNEAGLMIPKEKATMVFARLSKRLKILRLPDFKSYIEILKSQDANEERRTLISILTTNVTSFLREDYHFRVLKEDVLPDLIERGRKGARIRLWSAGCSSGQEAYSMAMTLLTAWPDAKNHDVKILATDIDPEVLTRARQGHYDETMLKPLPVDWRQTYFTQVETKASKLFPSKVYSVNQRLRDMITFRELNLMRPWPFSGKFDVIFCRNVVIYFAQETQNALWPKFERVCLPGATLFVGHSERIEPEANTAFEAVGHTTYRLTATS